MMNPEDLQSDLLALRRLYRLLVNDERHVKDAGSENLDKNARRLLINLLDVAANKAFDAHAKILGTQFRATNSQWSMPQGQSTDGRNLQSFSLRNAPTDSTYPSLPKVDCLTGQEIFSEPTNEVDLAGESGVRLKRCRVCLKPKVKQLTKEISFGGSKALTSINRLQNQNHKRSWEVQNEPSIVGGSAWSSNSPFLTNLTDQEDHISREASAKILQLESCISSLQVAAKHASFFKNDLGNEPKQIGYLPVGRSDPNSSTSQMIWKPRDMAHQWHDQTTRSINELARQGPLVNVMLPSSHIMSQQVEEPAVNKMEMFNQKQNQYDHTSEEAYYLFHSGGISSNLQKTEDKDRILHRNLSSQINREQFDQLQMAKKEAMRTSEMTEWRDPVGYGTPPKIEQQKSKFVGQKKPGKTYNDQTDHYRGKHKVVDPKILVSAATQWLSDTPFSSSNHSTQSQTPSASVSVSASASVSVSASASESSSASATPSPSPSLSPSPSPSPSPSSNSFSGSEGSSLQLRELYSGSSRSRSHEKSESEMSSVSSQDQSSSKSTSFESSGSMSRRLVSKKDHKKVNPKELKRKSENKMNTVSIQDQSPSMTSSSNGSSRSRRTVPKKGNQKEPKKKSESKVNTVSSRDQGPYVRSSSTESSGPRSRMMVLKKGHQKGNQKEPKRSESKTNTVARQNKSPSMSSSSKESSGSRSKMIVPKEAQQKGDKKEPKENEAGRLSKLKDKFAIIFHNHHHHHHHHHHHEGNDEDKHKKSLWKQAKNVIGNPKKVIGQRSRRKKDEAHGEHAVKKIEAHGEHAAKKIEAHGEQAVKKIEAHAVKKIEAHGEQAVKKIEAHAIKKIEAHGEQAAKKTEAHKKQPVKKNLSKALVVHKAAAKKQAHQLQALVGGLLKKSQHSLKPIKCKSVIKGTLSRVSGKKHGGGGGGDGGGSGGGGAKTGKKMQWWQMLRQQRKIKRIEKLRGKIKIGKKR